jgi:DNA repair exonuclease SbcCD ATPase subunit
MKQINLRKLTIRNFLSVGDEEVVIEFKPGLHIITGINKDKEDRRNGVGKSTIADAIHFAIFGSTIRELKKENIVNHINQKDCEVVLEVDIKVDDRVSNCIIVRKLEPSKCYLYINGEDKTRDSINNTTDYILKQLSASQDIFQNCVIMTLNNTIPFMGKKKVEKRKFIEGIFNLEVFSNMLQSVRSQYNDEKRDYDVQFSKQEEVEKSLSTHKRQKDKVENDKKEREEELVKRRDDNIKELGTLQKATDVDYEKEITTLNEKITELGEYIEKCSKKITALTGESVEHRTNKTHLKKQHDTLGTEDATCPVCLKPFSEHDKDTINNEKQDLTNKIGDLTRTEEEIEKQVITLADTKTKLKKKKTQYKDNVSNLKIEQNQFENNKTRIVQLEVWNKQIKDDIKKLKESAVDFDDVIKETEDRLKEVEGKLAELKLNLSLLEVVKFIVSEEGVKSYIVKKLLQLFNNRLAHYLNKMDANCLCIFNEYFEDEIIDEKGKLCSYFNFSGAERKNIDLACLFAFMDIRKLQGNVSYNFSVYDELLDSSLDERGVELVLDILRERVEKHNECIFVISHRKESTKAATGDIIQLEKENGITRRVAYTS